MRAKFKYLINYYAVVTAIASFSVGTLVLVLFKSSGDTGLIAIGYFYTWFAALVNTLLLLLLIIHTALRFNGYKEHLMAIGLVLLNLPITFLYIHIAL